MQSDLRGKMRCEIEVRSSGDLFYDLFVCKPHQVTNISPSEIQACSILEGDFGKNGSIIGWNYTHDGKACVSKQILENIDRVKKTITYRVIEGDLLTNYKTFLIHLYVKPGIGNVSHVEWTFEYEKLNEYVTDPTSLADFVVAVSKHAYDGLKP